MGLSADNLGDMTREAMDAAELCFGGDFPGIRDRGTRDMLEKLKAFLNVNLPAFVQSLTEAKITPAGDPRGAGVQVGVLQADEFFQAKWLPGQAAPEGTPAMVVAQYPHGPDAPMTVHVNRMPEGEAGNPQWYTEVPMVHVDQAKWPMSTESRHALVGFRADQAGHPRIAYSRAFALDFDCDEIWIHYDPALDQVQHTAQYTGVWTPHTTVDQVVFSFETDPCNHVNPDTIAFTAYAGDEEWTHVNGFTIEHIAAFGGVWTPHAAANQFVLSFDTDDCNHVDPISVAFGAYVGDEVWIQVVGFTINHIAAFAGVWTPHTGGAGEYVQSFKTDDCNHVDPTTVVFGTPASTTYTGDEIWIHLHGTQFDHGGPSSETACAGGGANDILTRIGWDKWYHIASGSVSATALAADELWITLGGYCYSHMGPYAADPSPINASGGAGTHCATLKFDSKGHYLSSTWD